MKFIKDNQKRNGFALTDVLLYVVISSFLLVTVVSFTNVIIEARVKNTVIAEVEQQGVHILRTVWRESRGAEEVIEPIPGQSGNILTLRVDGSIVSFSFDNSSGSLVRVEGGESTPLVGESIELSDFSFSNLGTSSTPASVRVEFLAAYRSESVREIYDYSRFFTATATLR